MTYTRTFCIIRLGQLFGRLTVRDPSPYFYKGVSVPRISRTKLLVQGVNVFSKVKKQIIEKLFNTGGGINFDSGTALGKSRKNRKAKKVNINVIMNNNLKKRFDCKRDWN